VQITATAITAIVGPARPTTHPQIPNKIRPLKHPIAEEQNEREKIGPLRRKATLRGGGGQAQEKCDENCDAGGRNAPPAIGQHGVGDHAVNDDAGTTDVQAGGDTVLQCAVGDEADENAFAADLGGELFSLR
jgi:hypothetical protein